MADTSSSMGIHAMAAVSTTAAAVGAAAWLWRRKGSSQAVLRKEGLDTLPLSVHSALALHLDILSDEALIKILRQLVFWKSENMADDQLVGIAQDLVQSYTRVTGVDVSLSSPTCTPPTTVFVCPKVRFGKTEYQIPIITTGGMRFQYSWLPDTVATKTMRVLQHASQANLRDLVRLCLRHGLNHFETALMYGTSEMQLAHCLHAMMQSGEIQRTDFILQTKIVPKENAQSFAALWNQSWKHWESTVGYIDLFAFHVVSSRRKVDWVLDDGPEGCFQFIQDRQAEGKIKRIGFSTHGTAANIMKLINSEKFDFVNIHCHYFGDYHAEGTMPSKDAATHGNLMAVQRARELDMGIFLISPFDKGGKLFRPSRLVARACGPQLSPMSFALLYGWNVTGCHTASVGVSKPSDLDDALQAAWLYSTQTLEGTQRMLQEATTRLNALRVSRLGQDWIDQGMQNLPDCEDPRVNGSALGHVLWTHNVVQGFGMYEFAKDRYRNLESAKWVDDSAKKSWQDNMEGFPDGNMGRGYVKSLDYDTILRDHYHPKLVLSKLQQAHEWLSSSSSSSSSWSKNGRRSLSDTELMERGWDTAYNLTVWSDYPGESPTPFNAVLQLVTFGRFGGGGKTKMFTEYARSVRTSLLLATQATNAAQ